MEKINQKENNRKVKQKNKGKDDKKARVNMYK